MLENLESLKCIKIIKLESSMMAKKQILRSVLDVFQVSVIYQCQIKAESLAQEFRWLFLSISRTCHIFHINVFLFSICLYFVIYSLLFPLIYEPFCTFLCLFWGAAVLHCKIAPTRTVYHR